MSDPIAAIIANLEAAEAGSEALDDAISSAILVYVGDTQVVGAPIAMRTYRHPDGSVGTTLRYTRSLDAALSVVPLGVWWSVDRTGYPTPSERALCIARITFTDGKHVTGFSRDPALALCIAALKAKDNAS